MDNSQPESSTENKNGAADGGQIDSGATTAKTSTKAADAEKSGLTDEQVQQRVAMRYKQLNQEAQVLVQKLLELEDEKRENELVLESISKLEDTRKCWRLVNGVLMEKTKLEVVPEMRVVINNLSAVANQVTQTLQALRQEIKQLEAAYEHIMKAAKASQS